MVCVGSRYNTDVATPRMLCSPAPLACSWRFPCWSRSVQCFLPAEVLCRSPRGTAHSHSDTCSAAVCFGHFCSKFRGFSPLAGYFGGCFWVFVCLWLFVYFTQNTMFKLLQISTELQHSYLCSPQEFLAFRHLSWRWPNGIACTQVLTATQVPEEREGNTRDEHGWAAKFRSRASVDTSSPTVYAGGWSCGC